MTDPQTPPASEVTEAHVALAAPNKSFSLSARRLLGSPACLNCGTELKGPFCYYCGQPDKNLIRFFPALIRDLLEDLLDLDSRFIRTLKPLLLHPGRLTRDYLDGRRFRYVPPMRLYILTSMVFFILAALLAGDAIDISTGTDGSDVNLVLFSDKDTKKEDIEAEAAEKVQEVFDEHGLSKEIPGGGTLGIKIDDKESTNTGDATAPDEKPSEEDPITINGVPWDRETNPYILPFVPDFINDWINNEIGESPQKAREIEANPRMIVDKMFEVLPVAVFVMLPLVALLFKFWYLFARRYYVEHLIHALHNHAFLFLIFILTLLADSWANWQDPAETGTVSEIASKLTIVLLWWIPLYLLISLKTVYQQSWKMTIAKFSLIGISYVVLLALVTAGAAIASFILL
jgi:hypothetical protein